VTSVRRQRQKYTFSYTYLASVVLPLSLYTRIPSSRPDLDTFLLLGDYIAYALFTAAPSLIFNENESEAVRDRLASLQWARAVLLFNVFSDCSAHETLEKYLPKKCQLTKNSRQRKLWKIVSNLPALFSFLQRMPLETR